MTTDIFARGIGKTVPLIGGAVSGGLTLATFKPMSHKLQNHLSKMARMSPEEFAKYEASKSIVLDEKDYSFDTDQPETVVEEAAENNWTCSCGAVNKSKFCPECGKAKPEVLPHYKCNNCGWEPEDKTRPPKFCPECGDPFNDRDIII